MHTRLVALGAGIIVCLGLGVWIYSAAFAPIDDPAYFCGAPDPSPVTSIAATDILQDCAAGKTFTLAKGEAIAVDLQGGNGVDTWTQWSDVSVSDGQVLSTVRAPARVRGFPPQRLDEVAVYRATKTGQATLTAVEQWCSGNTGTCRRGHLWRVTVWVG